MTTTVLGIGKILILVNCGLERHGRSSDTKMVCVGGEFRDSPFSGEVTRHRADDASSLSARTIHGLYYACPNCGKGDVPVNVNRGEYVCEVCGAKASRPKPKTSR